MSPEPIADPGPRPGGRSLLDIFARMGPRPYDWMYRRGAPWESGPRPELVRLVESGRISPTTVGPAALDVGCGSGADSVYLSRQGFRVTGVDFSRVAIDKARTAADEAGQSPSFVAADLLDLPASVAGPFDLIFDGGTVDDFPPSMRPRVASALTQRSSPGATLIMWCFYADRRRLPWFSLRGASRWGAPPIEPGEEEMLFGTDWSIQDLHLADTPPGAACFLMTRHH